MTPRREREETAATNPIPREDALAGQELARTTHELMDRVVRLRPGPRSAALAEQIAALIAELDQDDAVGEAPWTHTTSAVGREALELIVGAPRLGTTWSTFNPLAPPIVLRVEGEQAVGEVVLGSVFYGPPGRVHGGTVATLLDHAMGSLLNLLDRHSFTARLTVDYLVAAELGATLTVRAGVVSSAGRKTFTWGTISQGETLVAHAEGLFVRIPDEQP